MASSLAPSRTPPGVRELKLIKDEITKKPIPSRTPPGVRELKLLVHAQGHLVHDVAPLPGCVN